MYMFVMLLVGSPELIARVLDIGKSSKLKVKREDMLKLEGIEELARRAVKGRRISSVLNADILVNSAKSGSSSSSTNGPTRTGKLVR